MGLLGCNARSHLYLHTLELHRCSEIPEQPLLFSRAVRNGGVVPAFEGVGFDADTRFARDNDRFGIYDFDAPALAILDGKASCALDLETFAATNALPIQPSERHVLATQLNVDRTSCGIYRRLRFNLGT